MDQNHWVFQVLWLFFNKAIQALSTTNPLIYQYQNFHVGYLLHPHHQSKPTEMTTLYRFKLSALSSKREHHLLLTHHCPPVLSVVKFDPASFLIDSYNLFPRPPEGKGDCSFIERLSHIQGQHQACCIGYTHSNPHPKSSASTGKNLVVSTLQSRTQDDSQHTTIHLHAVLLVNKFAFQLIISDVMSTSQLENEGDLLANIKPHCKPLDKLLPISTANSMITASEGKYTS